MCSSLPSLLVHIQIALFTEKILKVPNLLKLKSTGIAHRLFEIKVFYFPSWRQTYHERRSLAYGSTPTHSLSLFSPEANHTLQLLFPFPSFLMREMLEAVETLADSTASNIYLTGARYPRIVCTRAAVHPSVDPPASALTNAVDLSSVYLYICATA